MARPDLERIIAPNPGPMTLEGTNTYVVGRDPAIVVDPGPDDAGHLDAVREAAEGRGGLGGIVLTHAHEDHAAGAEPLATATGAPLLPTEGRDQAGPFRVLPTPGHSADHVCLLLGSACLCGDLILGEGSSFVPPDGGSLATYLDSLRRLRRAEPELLLPGHGPEVANAVAKIDEYLEHRLERERKLVSALEAGERSRRRLLDSAWDDVPAELRPAAAVVMQAHLDKLAAEGRLPGELDD